VGITYGFDEFSWGKQVMVLGGIPRCQVPHDASSNLANLKRVGQPRPMEVSFS
jgi:hypothetical protein